MNTPPELSLTEFQNLCKKQVEYLDTISNLQTFEMIKIKAQIKNLNIAKEKNYNGKVYNIALTDGKLEVKAQSELNIINHIQDLDFVEAICFCQPVKDFRKESLTMCANIISIKSLTVNEKPHHIDYRAITLKNLDLQRNAFPKENNKISLSLIYSSSSSAKVDQDFLKALGDIKNEIKIEELRTRFNDVNTLVSALDAAKGNVLVIIRGGGAANDLTIFDDPIILQKISSSTAYRIAGIGHSADNNLVNTIVDFSASTPTAAGTHIKELLLQNNKNNWITYKLKKTNHELENQIAELQNDLKYLNQPKSQNHSSQRMNGILAIIIVILFLILIFK